MVHVEVLLVGLGSEKKYNCEVAPDSNSPDTGENPREGPLLYYDWKTRYTDLDTKQL